MKLYDTLSGRARSFSTHDDKVRMYVCGVTPYAASHIGHAMFSVVFDVVRRYLEFKGFEVVHVQNITDIDDKMIQGAAKLGVSTDELAEKYIDIYLKEMDALNVKRAHLYPRATLEIPMILEMVRALVDKGMAYAVDGDVYFRVRKDQGYGRLSHRSLDSMMAGARVEIDEHKEDVMDFALWKSQKPGEPAWDSPWGPGRPGWHIECSAMSITHLGETIDIHGGGQDLIFPHHENEIAQAESYTETSPFVRFWLHNGLLRLGEDKMSKSLGNIVSVAEALEKFSSDTLRLFFISSHYRSPLVYSDQNVMAQERAVERLRNALKPGAEAAGQTLAPDAYQERFVEAMDDDLNTPRALAVLFDLARDINRARERGDGVGPAQNALRALAGVLGLTLKEPEFYAGQDVAPLFDLLVEVRADLREAKQYELADKVRRRLAELGITLKDTPQGTEWMHTPRH
ncbi:MAG: cysteine--tRNA ligase [SAR202 cluster bacterium]|nr:cysteine--tRNA ligase [SAR202 cluster bacterium]